MIISVADTNPSVIRRFIVKTKLRHECWIWQGACNSKGYPTISVNGKTQYAHRLSHILFIGPIAPKDQVHHRCMNPKCVAPAHLQSMTADLNRKLQAAGVGEVDDIPF